AGCVRAAHRAGLELTVQHEKASVETDANLSYVHGSVDAAKVAAESGADAILTGVARLSARGEVERLKLEVRSAQNVLLATAEARRDDGFDPLEAGDRLCTELFRGWGPAVAKSARANPKSVYILGIPKTERSARFRHGCEVAASESGVTLVSPLPLPRGEGTR